MALHAFVVMPFGLKAGIDFNRVYAEYIRPALEGAGFDVFRADEETRAGNIRTDMFQELLVADVVVADLSIDNANVWYELGVRHALRARGVIQVQCSRDYMPFDVCVDRTLRYHIKDGTPAPATLEADRKALADCATETISAWHGRKVSPVYHLLRVLRPPGHLPEDLAAQLQIEQPWPSAWRRRKIKQIVAKRADTGSTWPLINHPRGKYYAHNSPILLRNAVRASTAAPTYFVPEKFDVGFGEPGAFVDGGVSMANNPALQLFLVATLKGFPFRYPTGEHRLLLVSVGTGVWQRKDDVDAVADGKLWNWAQEVPSMLMEDASWQNQLLLQYLSRSSTPWLIDREVGDLSTDLLTPEPALTYLRYNVALETAALQAVGLPTLAAKAEALREMSDASNREALALIGDTAAAQQVRDEHFPDAFNLTTAE